MSRNLSEGASQRSLGAQPRHLRLLTFTTLFPSTPRPRHGIFVETRLRHILASGTVDARVIAPVPWFPFAHSCFGEYALFARTPRHEERGGLQVEHPRYPILPRVGMTTAPHLLYWASRHVTRKLLAEGYDFDLIDAHYFYPDGVAAAMLAQAVNKPLVITARGTDINLIPQFRGPRRLIQWAAAQAKEIVTVCHALKDGLVALGVPAAKITVLRNGVDLKLFRPLDREKERTALKLTRPTLLSVGHLIKRKGHDIVIRALEGLPEVELLIAGDGEEERNLRNLSISLGVAERVRFLGAIPQHELPRYYTAADVLVLASSREGWANVLLEAMACGTPVIASRVWGTPEVVKSVEAGVLLTERNSGAVVHGYRELIARGIDRRATRRYAERFGWEETVHGQLALFRRVVTRDRA